MKEPNWLLAEAVVAVHQMLIAEHGGAAGVRDEGLLESALSRPINRFSYEANATVFDLAAAYAYGLAKNHPFIDGNKRIAFTAAAMLIAENGFAFVADKMDALETFVKLAAGEIEEDELARWIEANSEKA